MSAITLILIALVACSVSSVMSSTNRRVGVQQNKQNKKEKKSHEPKGLGSGYRYLPQPCSRSACPPQFSNAIMLYCNLG